MSLDTTAVVATLTRTTWSRPTRLKEFSRARQPWISWALIIASRTSLTLGTLMPAEGSAFAVRASQSVTARIPPRLSEG